MKPRPPFCLSLLCAGLLPGLLLGPKPGRAAGPLPGNDAVRAILRQRVDEQKRGVGIVVGLVDEGSSRWVEYGRTAREGGASVNARTIFEIGSVSKVFTSLLLADAVGRGEVKLDDPVAKYLPPEVKVPTRAGREITLLDLATHRSGLPRMPDNFTPQNSEDPYADYTPGQLYAFLSGYTLTRDIGAEYEYSNLGVALLGQALALRAGRSYEGLLEERICRPLGLDRTWINLPEELRARLAKPHHEDLSPAENWNMSVFAGAGGIRSSAEDMLRFVSVELGLHPSPIPAARQTAAAMQTTQGRRAAAGDADTDIGLGWHLLHKHEPTVVMHNGGTSGYRSFVGFVPSEKRGVVVLSNSANGVDDIGLHLLNPAYPLDKEPFALAPEVGEQYLGRYAFAPHLIFDVTRQGNRYFGQLTGQGALEMHPKSEGEFTAPEVAASLTFVRDAQGKVASVTLHQNSLDQSARRLSAGEAAALPKPQERVAVPIKPEVGDRYVGRYELTPGRVFTVTRKDDHYFAQLTGQERFEIFPSAEADFFYKVVDAQLTFNRGPTGVVTGLTLHQNGDFLAKRLP